MKKKLTIIVSLYNTEKYIARCLDAILVQQAANVDFRVMIVDDGSTDNSLAIAKTYQQKYSFIDIVVPGGNVGLGRTRNVGIKEATTDYIWFVDADDEILPGSLQSWGEVEEESDIYVFDYYINNVGGEKISFDIGAHPTNAQAILVFNPSAWNKIFRREFLLSTGEEFPPSLRHQDVATTYKWFALAKTITYMPRPMYLYYRFVQGALSTISNTTQGFNDHILQVSGILAEWAIKNPLYQEELFLVVYNGVSARRSMWEHSCATNKKELLAKSMEFFEKYSKYFEKNRYLVFKKEILKQAEHNYQTTISWKITKPLRLLKDMARYLRNNFLEKRRQ